MLQRVTFLSCLLFCLSASLLFGQGITSMQGTVLDPSGAAIPGATVELVNVATQARQSATSDSSGRYYFPQVTPGT
jgi:protocatechuate 3,4-dioxygenase beta subunit